MELRVLRYFLMVVAERNISRAAEKLHVSQPTISRQLSDLETELGVTLFERGQRSITLTRAGEYFASQARQIIELADKTVANVQHTHDVSGNIMIGSAELPMMASVVAAITHMRQTAPKVVANIYSTDADDVHARMAAGFFDFGVVLEPTDKTDYDFINLPGTSSWGVLVRDDSPLAQLEAVTVHDLQKQPVIMTRQHGSVERLRGWLGSSNAQLQVVATYNLLYNASIMVSAGVGSAICLDGIINTTGTNLRFVPLAPELVGYASLIWPKARQLSPAARVFIDAMMAAVGG
ncbi:LysR family transcriptional regulator [Lacticaseibacillus hulanensis]|uniref:LysR family transcriptional regulator n=1 Tax=Lacticaseibacillus hulanensis TaxID=2493111 RepID=UPI000FD91788|nr:LysR family transcriptional regulator [Lacticaseibacillus hulanensis]